MWLSDKARLAAGLSTWTASQAGRLPNRSENDSVVESLCSNAGSVVDGVLSRQSGVDRGVLGGVADSLRLTGPTWLEGLRSDWGEDGLDLLLS